MPFSYQSSYPVYSKRPLSSHPTVSYAHSPKKFKNVSENCRTVAVWERNLYKASDNLPVTCNPCKIALACR